MLYRRAPAGDPLRLHRRMRARLSFDHHFAQRASTSGTWYPGLFLRSTDIPYLICNHSAWDGRPDTLGIYRHRHGSVRGRNLALRGIRYREASRWKRAGFNVSRASAVWRVCALRPYDQRIRHPATLGRPLSFKIHTSTSNNLEPNNIPHGEGITRTGRNHSPNTKHRVFRLKYPCALISRTRLRRIEQITRLYHGIGWYTLYEDRNVIQYSHT
jgi:hypothetical protein